MHPRFALILTGLAIILLVLAGVALIADAAGAAPTAPKLQFPTFTPTLTPPPLPGAWTLGPSVGGGRSAGLAAVSATGPNNIWAVGTSSGVAYTPIVVRWDGQQWAGVGNLGIQGDSWMATVLAIAPDKAWVFGGPRIAKYWDGSTWIATTVPGDPIAAGAASSTDLWAIVGQGIIHGDGQAWFPVPLPSITASNLQGVAARTADDAWIVGSDALSTTGVALTLTEHWDGTTWQVVPSPNIGMGANRLQSVTMVAADDVWAVGSYDNHGVDQTLIEHWNGSGWTVVPSPNRSLSANWLGKVSANSPTDVWVAGTDGGPAVNETLIEHWDGTIWSIVPSPNSGWMDNGLNSIAAVGPAEAWAVGSYADNGNASGWGLTEHYQVLSPASPTPAPCANAFQRVTVPTSGALNAIAAVAPNDIWAVGDHIVHWDGTTWATVSGPDMGVWGSLRGVAALGPNDIWAVGYYNDRTIIQTLVIHWNGVFWDALLSPNPGDGSNYLTAVAARAPNDVWAVGYANQSTQDQALILHWDGANWHQMPLPPHLAQPSYLYGVAAVSANDAWAVGATTSNTGSSLALHWDGQQWQSISSPNIHALNGVTALAANDIWAAGDLYDGHLLHWDGSQWSDGGMTTAWRLFGVAAGAGNDVWAAGRYGGGGRYSLASVAHWDGSQWANVGVNGSGLYENQFNAVAVAGPDDVWAVGSAPGQSLLTHYTAPCGTPTPLPTRTATSTPLPTATPSSLQGKPAPCASAGCH